jgi:hypothetical protein
MKLPKETKPALWGAAAGAVAIMVVGFSSMGWKTGSSAAQMASTQAAEAVVAAMVPFCVAKAKLDTDGGVMTKFRAETSSYARTQLVQTAGWATLGGATTPDYALASACSDRLHMAAG